MQSPNYVKFELCKIRVIKKLEFQEDPSYKKFDKFETEK